MIKQEYIYTGIILSIGVVLYTLGFFLSFRNQTLIDLSFLSNINRRGLSISINFIGFCFLLIGIVILGLILEERTNGTK